MTYNREKYLEDTHLTREKARQHYRENPQVYKDRAKRYFQANKEACRALGLLKENPKIFVKAITWLKRSV